MLVTSKEMLNKAKKEGWAVGAFNFENMEMAQAIISAAEELYAPVILQTTYTTVKYGSFKLYSAIIKALAEASNIPIVLHLDHCTEPELVLQAMENGYTSLMFDGSRLSFEENIKYTKYIVQKAEENNIPVEAELGEIGGREDETEGNINYTDPEKAEIFCKETSISSLAPAIGTAHGIYKTKPKLDISRLDAIKRHINIPIVLHGASGVPYNSIKECIKRGVSKVNYATELREAFSKGVKEVLKDKPNIIDPKEYLKHGREMVKIAVKEKINLLGSNGMAD